jgi:hypothetical protein
MGQLGTFRLSRRHPDFPIDLVGRVAAVSTGRLSAGRGTGVPQRCLDKFKATSAPSNAVTTIKQRDRAWLEDALRDLGAGLSDAAAEGYEPVTDVALSKARGLLGSLARRINDPPLVGPTPEGGIAIEFRTAARDGVLLVCEPNGAGAYFRSVGGKKARGRCDDASELLAVGGWAALAQANIS